ncbi:MAG: TIM-barrel domain-containing protein, partial [Burkholderiales bacterium]
ECKITGIMKPRIIISTVKGHLTPMTTQGASAQKLGIYSPTEKPFPDYFSGRMSIDLDFYKPICRQWYWHATWTHQCMQHGIVGFWNDEADSPATGNFEFLHMQQALYDGQRQDRPRNRVWSMNRNFYLGSQRYAYATWSGDINTGFEVMRLQTVAMINTINIGQMRWAQDTGGFDGHPTPECYARWFQFTAVCPTLRTHCTLGERRQPWVYGDQACETVKQAIRQRYSWFFYVYALEHAACTQTGVGIVRPLTFDYPKDHNVATIADQWMFGHWIMAAPVLEKMGSGKEESTTRRIYLPPGDWIDYFRGDRLKGGRWIHYQLNADSWMDWPLFIKDGAIIPVADPVKAVHTAKPEMIYLDIYPAAQRSQGEFYDDDGDSYDYQHGQFHRQIISVQAHTTGTDINLSPNAGAYSSTVKHFVLRVHGHAAAEVTVNGQAVKAVENRYALSQATSGWHTDVDVIGAVTFIKIPAGQKVDVHLSGTQHGHKEVEILDSSDASISGPTPPTVPLKTNNDMYTDTHLFGPSPSLRPVILNNHKGYTAGGFIAGFDLPGTAATYYLRRHKAGRYRVVFRVANADLNTIKTMNVYVNGIMAGELTIASTASWDTWQNIGIYLPLAAGNNTIMLRHDENNTGKINVDCVEVPYRPTV